MSGNRALFITKRSIGHGQYPLKIQNHAPWDDAQWFVFDRRTRSIRSANRRQLTISREQGVKRFIPGGYAVARPWKNSVFQKTFYNKSKMIQDWGAFVLTLHQWRNRHNWPVVWWWSKNHASQKWKIDTKGVTIPRYPLKDGRRFQIKSRMATNRALFWHEHIGHQQYRLRIQNSAPWIGKQWFVFDWRTKTIRAWSDRRKVISNQYGQGFNINVAAVVRLYKAEPYQKTLWFGGSRKNIRNFAGKCLDVHGGHNHQHRHTIFYNCHNGLNQAWYVDTKGTQFPRYPIKDGVKFQIKSRMSTNKALFWHEHIGGNQFRLRIRFTNPADSKQWWSFDTRTRTIRAYGKKNYVLANQRGTGFRINVAATIRKYTGHFTEKSKWFGGSRKNIRNLGGKCLDVHGGSNTQHRHVIFYNCHNGVNQAWYVDQKGVSWPHQIYGDGFKF
jgi:hypothetical protein